MAPVSEYATDGFRYISWCPRCRRCSSSVRAYIGPCEFGCPGVVYLAHVREVYATAVDRSSRHLQIPLTWTNGRDGILTPDETTRDRWIFRVTTVRRPDPEIKKTEGSDDDDALPPPMPLFTWKSL